MDEPAVYDPSAASSSSPAVGQAYNDVVAQADWWENYAERNESGQRVDLLLGAMPLPPRQRRHRPSETQVIDPEPVREDSSREEAVRQPTFYAEVRIGQLHGLPGWTWGYYEGIDSPSMPAYGLWLGPETDSPG